MRNSNFRLILMLLFINFFSCSNELDIKKEETIETENYLVNDLSVKTISKIDNPLLSKQLSISEKKIKQILPANFSYLLTEHNIDDMFLDLSNIIVESKLDEMHYTILVTIPHIRKNKKHSQFAYLMINVNCKTEDVYNKLIFGLQMEESLFFNAEGIIKNIENKTNTFSSRRAPVKYSQIPLSVVCNYFANSSGSTPSTVASYCGFYGSGQTIPASPSVIELLISSQLVNNYNDLYILTNPNSLYPDGIISFSSFYPYPFQSIKQEMIDFYNQAWISQINGYAFSNSLTTIQHINKQTFIDSFIKWMVLLQDSSPDAFSYLSSNPNMMNVLFNFFADYNLQNHPSESVYLNMPFGLYASNPDVVCVTSASQYLLTADGFDLIQQLDSNSITLE